MALTLCLREIPATKKSFKKFRDGQAISFLGIHPKELKAGSHIDICKPRFVAVLFTIAKRKKQPNHPLMDEWTNKMCHIRTREYYSDLKEKEILTYATAWISFKDIILSKISQSQ